MLIVRFSPNATAFSSNNDDEESQPLHLALSHVSAAYTVTEISLNDLKVNEGISRDKGRIGLKKECNALLG